eukprot:COSAG01_NODE_8984_length_2594_cov_1.443287_3_plen_190_part_00
MLPRRVPSARTSSSRYHSLQSKMSGGGEASALSPTKSRSHTTSWRAVAIAPSSPRTSHGFDTQRLRQASLRYKSTSARGGSDGTSERGSILFSRAEGGNAPSEDRRPVHTGGHCPARPQHHATPQNSPRPSQRCGVEQRRPWAPQQCSLGNRRTPWPACPPSVALLACSTPPSLNLLVVLDIHVVAVYG